MDSLEAREAERCRIQATLDAQKTPQARNRCGQFATPPALARDILAYARANLPQTMPVRFCDPAVGTGAFASALYAAFPRAQIAGAIGCETDPAFAQAARQLWGNRGFEVWECDFTQATPPRAEAELCTLLICNPPYIRHHHLGEADKARLRASSAPILGAPLSGLAGMYCHFLALAHTWLAPGALSGWLVPSEFMDVNYGQPLKTYLLERVTLERIHRFDPNDVQFADALVSSAVVWFRNAPPPAEHSVRFTYGGSLQAPDLARDIPARVLQEERKWTRFPRSAERSTYDGSVLKDFFAIKRGLATGDNAFFILSGDQIAEQGLPVSCFRPILPSPRYLRIDEVFANANGVPLIERPLFLLDCALQEEEIAQRFPALAAYLAQGRAQGVADRYLCQHRKPWYAQEKRLPAPYLCTYIGRSDAKHRAPFRFILNHSQATVANSYLALYPKPSLQRALEVQPDLKPALRGLLAQISAQALLEEGRVYGGGLHKLEPRELGNVPAQAVADLLLAADEMAQGALGLCTSRVA